MVIPALPPQRDQSELLCETGSDKTILYRFKFTMEYYEGHILLCIVYICIYKNIPGGVLSAHIWPNGDVPL